MMWLKRLEKKNGNTLMQYTETLQIENVWWNICLYIGMSIQISIQHIFWKTQ